jgi:hypothetical protein
VWPLLGGLAGRDARTPPGRGFVPAPWRIPAAWLVPFPTGDPWPWSAAGGRIRVDHPAGFPVLALPRTPEPAPAQLRRELAGLDPPTLRQRSLPRLPNDARSAWVAAVARYVRARCALALDCVPEDVPDLLLRRPAQVRTTPTTLLVRFSLADHPLPIRLAGLDRDPGWVPAAGRSVAFEFAEAFS